MQALEMAARLQIAGGWASSPAPIPSALQARCMCRARLLLPSQCVPSPTRMGLKIVRTYDASFQLKPECEETLHRVLSSATFRSQVAEQFSKQSEINVSYDFTGELFQPVPWSITTRHGMPQEFEKYVNNPEFAIINVPPNFMFQAKVFKPSRLCAIFKRVLKEEPEF